MRTTFHDPAEISENHCLTDVSSTILRHTQFHYPRSNNPARSCPLLQYSGDFVEAVSRRKSAGFCRPFPPGSWQKSMDSCGKIRKVPFVPRTKRSRRSHLNPEVGSDRNGPNLHDSARWFGYRCLLQRCVYRTFIWWHSMAKAKVGHETTPWQYKSSSKVGGDGNVSSVSLIWSVPIGFLAVRLFETTTGYLCMKYRLVSFGLHLKSGLSALNCAWQIWTTISNI